MTPGSAMECGGQGWHHSWTYTGRQLGSELANLERIAEVVVKQSCRRSTRLRVGRHALRWACRPALRAGPAVPGSPGPPSTGLVDDIPLAGDWTGPGTATVGAEQPPAQPGASGVWYLRRSNTPGEPENHSLQRVGADAVEGVAARLGTYLCCGKPPSWCARLSGYPQGVQKAGFDQAQPPTRSD